MIREDRELLTELARLNRDMAPLAMRIMEGSAGSIEQQKYAQRLIAVGEQLKQRAEEAKGTAVEGEFFGNDSLTLPELTIEPHRIGEHR